MSLDGISDTDLHAEIESRRKASAAETWRIYNEKYGPCPECGEGLVSVDSQSVQEHWAAPNWRGWPIPPPDGWHGRELVAQDFETTLTCKNGHTRMEFQTVVHDRKEAAAQREP